MGNIIGLDSQTSISDYICMSNGLTNVFINVLSLSGSRMAKTVDEKRLIVWLSEKDQSKIGIGTVGFDICEMPWNLETFEQNKQFLLKVIDAAENKMGWECLDYTPNQETLFPCLKQFSVLVSQMSRNAVQLDILEKWLLSAYDDDPVLCDFPVCKKHNTLLTVFGCQVCNN